MAATDLRSLAKATPLLRESLHDRAVGPSRKFTLTGSPTPFKLDRHRAPKQLCHWTDDTDHALLLLLSFLYTATTATDSLDPLPTQQDLARRLRVWCSGGLRVLDTLPLGLGRLVGTVVATKGFDVDPVGISTKYWEETGRKIAPNGSLMRTHPLGVMTIFRQEEEAFHIAAELSRVTHVDPRCVISCIIGAGLVRLVARGEVESEEDVDGLIRRAVAWTEGWYQIRYEIDDLTTGERELNRDELYLDELFNHIDGADLDALKSDDTPAIGYVYKCLGSGVALLRQAIRRTKEIQGSLLDLVEMFEQLITDLIMRGGDADTNASFAGALLGGYLGYTALPDHWKHGLLHGKWLMSKAESLCVVLGLKDGQYDGHEDKDTDLHGGRGEISQEEMERRFMVLQAETIQTMQNAGARDGQTPPAEKSDFNWRRLWPKKENKNKN
ncbi:ADP-ribosylglycohydrolase [Podospora australis]|uniref:ADP-ribosylglycohydrolase n=1 Tax=Podospora australis TaxID=1536484 RepID=A0AAN6WN83_9PEZI|nr:ADP-ribosylglycohydrolase [Podospora australis]